MQHRPVEFILGHADAETSLSPGVVVKRPQILERCRDDPRPPQANLSGGRL
jgi:hypothetical protein